MYLGVFDSYRFTPETAMDSNSIVTSGPMVGVTRANVPAGEVGLAFIANPVSVYSFAVDALEADKSVGAAVYIDGSGDITFAANDGASPATAYTQLGVIWKAATAGDTEIIVALV